MQHKMKEVFRGIPDEFMTSNLASQAKVRALLTQSLFLGNHLYVNSILF